MNEVLFLYHSVPVQAIVKRRLYSSWDITLCKDAFHFLFLMEWEYFGKSNQLNGSQMSELLPHEPILIHTLPPIMYVWNPCDKTKVWQLGL